MSFLSIVTNYFLLSSSIFNTQMLSKGILNNNLRLLPAVMSFFSGANVFKCFKIFFCLILQVLLINVLQQEKKNSQKKVM